MSAEPLSDNRPERRFQPHELILSKVTEDDLLGIAEGYYGSFPTSWFDKIEPPHLRKEDRFQKYAERMKPWIKEPWTRWTKITLSPSSPDYDPSRPNRIIGHAGWLTPGRTENEIVNFWRRDASEKLNWTEKMGWSREYDEELWSGTDVKAYQESLLQWDEIREHYLEGVPHWLLAPLWTIPEFQGRGVASKLLRDGIALAEQDGALFPLYLEAMPSARTIYAHLGWKGVVGRGEKMVMIRNAPEGIRVQEEEQWAQKNA